MVPLREVLSFVETSPEPERRSPTRHVYRFGERPGPEAGAPKFMASTHVPIVGVFPPAAACPRLGRLRASGGRGGGSPLGHQEQ